MYSPYYSEFKSYHNEPSYEEPTRIKLDKIILKELQEENKTLRNRIKELESTTNTLTESVNENREKIQYLLDLDEIRSKYPVEEKIKQLEAEITELKKS